MIDRYYSEGIYGVVKGIVAIGLVILIMIPAMARNKIGGGDVKLLAVLTGILKQKYLIYFWFFSFLIALIIYVLKSFKNKNCKDKQGILMAFPIFISYLIIEGGMLHE